MTTIPTGRFVWFEYLAPDTTKAKGFYGEVFGWTTQGMPIPGGGQYDMIAVAGETIGGYPPHPAGAPPKAHWLSHLQVADARATIEQIKSLGGTVKMQPVDMGMGTYAVAADPLGAVFALWQPAKAEGTGDFRGKPGTFCWNELLSPDPDRSVAFYQAIGGFGVDRQEMPGMGTYNVLTFDGKPRAGITKPAMPGVPTVWLPYIQVANADATVAKATKLGGGTKVPPVDVPNVGRIAILTDSLDAAIGLLQPAS